MQEEGLGRAELLWVQTVDGTAATLALQVLFAGLADPLQRQGLCLCSWGCCRPCFLRRALPALCLPRPARAPHLSKTARLRSFPEHSQTKVGGRPGRPMERGEGANSCLRLS